MDVKETASVSGRKRLNERDEIFRSESIEDMLVLLFMKKRLMNKRDQTLWGEDHTQECERNSSSG